MPLLGRSEEDEKKIREDEEIKRRKEEDLRRRREEEIKRRREVVARVWKQPKVLSATATEVDESHRGRPGTSQSRKFLNLFGNSASQYSATGSYFLFLFICSDVSLQRLFYKTQKGYMSVPVPKLVHAMAPQTVLASATHASFSSSLHLPAASLLPPGGPHVGDHCPKALP